MRSRRKRQIFIVSVYRSILDLAFYCLRPLQRPSSAHLDHSYLLAPPFEQIVHPLNFTLRTRAIARMPRNGQQHGRLASRNIHDTGRGRSPWTQETVSPRGAYWNDLTMNLTITVFSGQHQTSSRTSKGAAQMYLERTARYPTFATVVNPMNEMPFSITSPFQCISREELLRLTMPRSQHTHFSRLRKNGTFFRTRV